MLCTFEGRIVLGTGYHFSSKNAVEVFRRGAFAQTSTSSTKPERHLHARTPFYRANDVLVDQTSSLFHSYLFRPHHPRRLLLHHDHFRHWSCHRPHHRWR
jgi:hypothetical protein